MTYDEVLWSERQDRKYQDLICVRLAMMVMNSCGWAGLSAKVLKFMQWRSCIDSKHTAQAFIVLNAVGFFYVNHFFDFYVRVNFVNTVQFLVIALTTIFKFILRYKVLRLIGADHFIHTVNDLLLRMSIGGSGYLCWGRGRNLIAPSECSLRTWLDLQPLLMFFICVVTTFLLTEISPGSFHVHCSLEIHAPVTPTGCRLHSGFKTLYPNVVLLFFLNVYFSLE